MDMMNKNINGQFNQIYNTNEMMNNMNNQINQMNNIYIIMNNNMNNKINKDEKLNNSINQKEILDYSINKNEASKNMEEIDVYPYILEKKKILVLVRNDETKKKIKIPISLRKNELYITVEQFKINRYSEMKLFYKNKILNNDESSIDDIYNGDEINIIEEFKGNFDLSYLENNPSKYNKENLINITFEKTTGHSINLVISRNSTIREMINLYFLKKGISEKYKNLFLFINGATSLDINDISTLFDKNIINHKKIIVEEKNSGLNGNIKGKKLNVSILNQNNKLDSSTYIGTLNQIKDLFDNLNSMYPDKNINKITIEKKEYKKNDKHTFSSIGIRDNFICHIIFNIKEEKKDSICIII